ncbi:conjugal transfer protein TraD [Leptothoe sp. LEGE 181152]|nr:conjugal transfer protein TraD [Leptothoe sp. LEGE 181152]
MTGAKEKLERELEKEKQKLELQKQKIKVIQRRIKTQERKQRTRELIQLGGLVEIAALREVDKGALLGLLLHSKQLLEDGKTYRELKRLGDFGLQRRAKKRREKAKG